MYYYAISPDVIGDP